MSELASEPKELNAGPSAGVSGPLYATGGPRGRVGRAIAPPVVVGIGVLTLWEALTHSGVVSAFFLPSPADVVRQFAGGLAHDGMIDYAGRTLAESAAGSGLGLAVALPLAYLVAHSRVAAAGLEPYLAASQALPAVALAPLLALWLGYGVLPIAVLCALLVFFPVFVATTVGLRLLDRDVLDAARVDGANRGRLFLHIEVPLALASTLSGVRNGVTLSITGAVVGEFVMGGNGLGELLSVQRDSADTAGLFATLLMLALLAAALYGAIRLIERMLIDGGVAP